MLIRLIRLLLSLLVPSPLPDTSEANRFHMPSATQENDFEFSGIRPILIEGEVIWDNEPLSTENPHGAALDSPTTLFRTFPDNASSNTSYYRDEDGEMRPVRLDRSGLADAMLEELAAEFLRAKADAETVPDILERAVLSALRDTYSRELWHRAQRGAEHVHAGGRDYVIVPRKAGIVELILIA